VIGGAATKRSLRLPGLFLALLATAAVALMFPLAADAAFPGINGKIAFVSDRDGTSEVYSMNPDGNGQTRLTTPGQLYANAEFPKWSPDGQEIAFSSGERIVYAMNADGSGLTELTPDATVVHEDPSWSPDGTQIAFASEPLGSFLSIWKMNADGSSPVPLNTGDGSLNPAWSPDGTRIAYWEVDGGSSSIWVMNQDGSGQTQLSSPPSGRDEFPNWSPDGTMIAFDSTRDGSDEIYVMKADGQGITRLTNSSGANWGPVWSPDGTKIAFVSSRDGNNQIYEMNADGSGQTRVTNNLANDWEPDWQPAPLPLVPSNDDFANAIVLSGEDVMRIGDSNVGAGLELGEPTQVAGSPAGTSVWYRWTAPASGRVSVDTGLSGFDTLLGVYTGSAVGSLTEIASNDDAGTDYLTSSVGFDATVGTTYQIRVDGFQGDTGNVDLHLRETEGVAPPNDLFANATELDGMNAVRTGDSNVGASLETGEPAVMDGAPAGRSVWYRWTAPASGTLSLDTSGSSFDTLLGLYTGSTVGDLSEVAVNDDAASDLTSAVVADVVGGTTYWIRVDGYAGQTGTVNLHLAEAVPPDAPTGVTASPGAGQATVSWNAPAFQGSSPITSYELTAYVGGVEQGFADIPAADGTTVTITGLTNGTTYTFRLAAINDAGIGPESVDSNPVTPENPPPAPLAPNNSTLPTISGTPKPGQMLTAAPGTWNGTGPITYSYQWTSCNGTGAFCVEIPGETSSTYLVTSSDAGSTFRVVVTASNVAGHTSATSAATAAVPMPPPCLVPKLKGKTVTKARTLLHHAHCVLGRISYAHSQIRRGRIASQRPHAGATRPRGTKVSVVVSRGPRRS
jgi:Tol biopolymer transport system component